MKIEMLFTASNDVEVSTTSTGTSNPATYWTNEASSVIRQAIKKRNSKTVKKWFKDRSLVNEPLETTGVYAGYTALHFACMEYHSDIVELLVKNYHADVNAVADDGARPIHLACIQEYVKNVDTLAFAGADIDIEIEKNLYMKHVSSSEIESGSSLDWCDDFGDKVTILTFAFLHGPYDLIETLISHDVDFKIPRSIKVDKTILMYNIERRIGISEKAARKLKDLELFHVCDDDGFPATHYLLHPKYFGDFRYDAKDLFDYLRSTMKQRILNRLIPLGADIHATANGNPDTLLYNMAAYRSDGSILQFILPEYDYITESKALFFATLPIGDPETSFRLDPSWDENLQWEGLRRRRKDCTKLILKDLVNRLEFGIPVPKGEKELMDKLIATDPDIKKIVHNYEKYFIQEKLKNIKIQYGQDKSITYYDLILMCCNETKLRVLVKNADLMQSYRSCASEGSLSFETDIDARNRTDHLYFDHLLDVRIKRASTRVELLDKLKKIEQLRKVIPLPYELVLDTVEFLNNQDLKSFVEAFFSRA